CRHSIELILGPAKFDCDIPAFDEAGFVQALAEDAYTICIRTGRSAADVPDHRDARLLCARGQWPCNCSATEKPDEFPSPHGFAHAEDYIGYKKTITSLDRELCRSSHPSRTATVSALGHKRTSTTDEATSGARLARPSTLPYWPLLVSAPRQVRLILERFAC